MRFFIPEWDDRVDPGYDFLTDSHSATHNSNPLKNDYYMWDIFGIDKVPFDGVLVSIATIQQNSKKYQSILETGIHQFLRLPHNFEIIADCGAFSYIDTIVPPYKTSEVLKLYSELGFNYGVSVDHLVVPMYKDQNQKRIKITYDNGVDAYNEWRKNYKSDFQLIVAVQGAEVSDYLDMFEKYYLRGIRHFAFGSLVRAPTFFIIQLIDTLIQNIKSTKKSPELIHLFGIARCALFPKFKELEELGIQVSFDSASYLRKAWLTSPSTQFNYIDQSWEGYAAIRIPQKLSQDKEDLFQISQEYLNLAQECLEKLRKYDNNNITLDEVMSNLKVYNEKTHEDPKLLSYYQRTLKLKAWKHCDCPICKEIGVDVAIFRGNNRNRRRGFHNLFVFHKLLKDETTWQWWKTKEISKRLKNRERTSLEFLKGKKNVLILTSCTKNKLGYDDSQRSEAREMYQGTLFKKVKTYAEAMNFEYRIISAEYGLLLPTDHINGYNKRLKTTADVDNIRLDVEEKLIDQIAPYDTIVVIAGEKYRQVLLNLFSDERFVFLKTRGIGDMIKIVSDAIPKNKQLSEF
jgi:hypothetical protein